MGELVNDNSSWTTTVPSSLSPGEYFIRHEVSGNPNCSHSQLLTVVTATGNPYLRPASILPRVCPVDPHSEFLDDVR